MTEKLILRLSAVIAGISGVIILTGVILPIAVYERNAKERYPSLLSPIVERGGKVLNYTSQLDYTKASNWFVGGAPKEEFAISGVSFYTLSIPKLKIENATVSIGGEDLSKSLIQYPGTATPGKLGNTVVFGHSILPIFYNPKDYMAIFSTLPTLKVGDEIFVNYDGVFFKYKVVDMYEVSPTNLSVLSQDYNDSYLSLITCTPPGDPRKPKRLIVKAKVVPFSGANASTGY